MPAQINLVSFDNAHEAFLEYMLRESGVPFTSFQHPFFQADEVKYKRRVYYKAEELLQVKEWKKWLRTPGKIIEATKQACRASNNLLDHKRGPMGFSETALYRVSEPIQIEGLEHRLFDLFNTEPFSIHFDKLASFLREYRLGCKWDFISFLAFLYQPMHYFPVRSTYMDILLEHYGSSERIVGIVSWDKYSILLELAENLKAKLSLYGTPDAIEIHSYMWIVAYLVRNARISENPIATTPNFESELNTRIQRAKERERIGLLGEQYVYDNERHKLLKAGRQDLVNRIRLVSANDDSAGYDLCSFSEDGKELHIEVKTTSRTPEADNGFWLSDNEKSQAQQDSSWTVCRVWDINSIPSHQFLGNIVTDEHVDWQLKTSSWFVERKR